MNTDNPWEEINRLRKVVAIVDLLDNIARHQQFDPHLDAGAIAGMLSSPETTGDVWDAIAFAAGQTEPSEKTRAQVVSVYERRALAANDRVAAS